MDIKRAFFLISFLLFASCNSGNASSSDGDVVTLPTSTNTPEQSIAALESSGAIPSLDRSQSIQGPDSNNNGVRDDIDLYIESRSYTPRQVISARQIAKAFQSTIVATSLTYDAAATQIERSVDCAYDVFGDEAGALVHTLEQFTANTRSRIDAYMRFNDSRDGTVSRDSIGNPCD